MRHLQYFKGKVCTILTEATNRMFDETQHVNTFVGIVDEIDEWGVWILRVSSKGKSFFPHKGIIAIIEESVTLFTDEEAKEVQKNLENQARIPDKNPQQLISVENLKQLKKSEKK